MNIHFSYFRFFDQLGYVFKFVKDDVVEKLGILQGFLDQDESKAKHFETIQQAIDYETENDLIKKNSHNFARTLLRLHRALLFIEEFLCGLSEKPASDTSVSIASHAYDSTLYHHRKCSFFNVKFKLILVRFQSSNDKSAFYALRVQVAKLNVKQSLHQSDMSCPKC